MATTLTQVLENPTARRIIEAIEYYLESWDGINRYAGEIRDNIARLYKLTGYRYHVAALPPEPIKPISTSTAGGVYAYLRACNTATVSEIATELGVSPASVRYALSKGKYAGLFTVAGRLTATYGRALVYRLA